MERTRIFSKLLRIGLTILFLILNSNRYSLLLSRNHDGMDIFSLGGVSYYFGNSYVNQRSGCTEQE